jgi:hypothetical protein
MLAIFSHSGRDKALVKRIGENLPRTIRVWLDEYDVTFQGRCAKLFSMPLSTS